MKKLILINSLALLTFLSACTGIEPKPFVPSSGHIHAETQPAGEIPELVTQAPILPAPAPVTELEKYTVVVNEVPVKELLFALARDAKVNVDIDPGIEGVVTINAIDQTLPQILDRIARQVDLRYEYNGDNLFIQPDAPYLKTYAVDYVNLSRDTSSTSSVSTQIASASGGDAESGGSSGNTSTTDVTTESTHHFWVRLVSNISAILGEKSASAAGGGIVVTKNVIPNPESSVISVRATSSQHKQIQSFIDLILASAKRQVLIQTTIVEVTLNERYQAGIDWKIFSTGALSIASITAAGIPAFIPAALSSFVIKTEAPAGTTDNISATVSLLDQFGKTNILSSPQIMALNNQTAILKVVENRVYFEVSSDTTSTQGVVTTTFDTTAKTVPIGIVMTVTPQIDSNGTITLVVRPTISRFAGEVNDPNPDLILPNPVPQIAVREMESVLRMTNGQIGILGGLMTDEAKDNDAGLPGAKDVGLFGNLFKTTSAEYTKKELVIFIKPIIITNPSVEGDLSDYKQYLDSYNNTLAQPVETEVQ